MEGAADAVVRHIGDLKSLLVDALTGQGGVTVDLDTQRCSAHSEEYCHDNSVTLRFKSQAIKAVISIELWELMS